MQTVAEIMTRDVKTVTTSTSIRDLATIFSTHRIGTVPVVDENGDLLGIITETDLVEQNRSLHIPTVISLFDWIIYLESDRKFMEELKRVSAQTVGDIYTRDVITVTPDTVITKVADLMAEKKIHTVPVVEGLKLVGVVSRIDLIRTMNR